MPATSVVVVSRHRPADLALCLGALALQDHPLMEVVLVADPAGLGVRPDLDIKRVAFDEANISAARNLGITAAAGAVVAFIDDDAVAEPTWARRLAEVFVDPQVIAATGWTRGPWGRTWQSRGEAITPDGPQPLAPKGDAPTAFRPADGVTLGPLGTNCAFRRDALAAVGGFDPAFAYHLDESDLALRLAARFPQAASVLVPLAEVTHGSAASARRGAARVPRDLGRLGRSEAIFAARHGGDPASIVPRMRRSLLGHMLAGRIEPQVLAPRLATLQAGIDAVAAEGVPPAPDAGPLPHESAFRRLPGEARPAVLLDGRFRARRRLRAEAADAVAAGAIVTLILRLPGLLPHRTRFTPGGWWEQTGGGWGPSQPEDHAITPRPWTVRAAREAAVLARVRGPHVR